MYVYMYMYVIVTEVSSNMPYASQYNIIYSSNSHTTLRYYLVLLLVFLEHHYALVPLEWTSREALSL